MNNLDFKTNYGFTLVEMLVYTALFALMVSALVAFMSTLSQSRIRNQAVLEVNDQAAQVMRVITQNVRNATSVSSPSIGTSGSSLSVNTVLPATTPTTFTVSGGTLYITQGSGGAVALTNNRVAVSNVLFSNLSRASTFGTVRVSFTLRSVSSATQAQYNYSANFYGTGTLR